MPEYEFVCDNKGCSNGGKIVTRVFGMNADKFANCEKCGNILRRKLGNFVEHYKGSGFTRSAEAREEVDVFKR